MKKCLFLVFHQDVNNFLERIHEAGAIHVVLNKDLRIDNQKLVDHFQKISVVSNAVNSLKNLNVICEDTTPTENMGEQAFEISQAIKLRKEEVRIEQQRVEKEIKLMSSWGDFSYDTTNNLEKAGWIIGYYSCSSKNFKKEWETDYNAFVVSNYGSMMNFVTFTKEDISEIIDAETVKLAERSLSQLKWKKKHLIDRNTKINDQEKELAETSLNSMILYLQNLRENCDYEAVESGCERPVDEKVFLLEGYVPSEKEHDLVKMLENDNGVYFEMTEPNKTDKVPVKLKNNAFVSLFETIGGLYNLPDYKELDMTPFMAPFYLIFFGFCLQDIGYGLLLLLGGIFLQKKMPNIKVFLKLAIYFGISTIIFGMIVGNIFGVDLKELKGVAWLEPFQQYMLSIEDMFNFALILGAIQIVFGMGVKVVNVIVQDGFKYALSSLGWFMLLVGLASVYGLSKFTFITPEVAKIAYYIVLGVCGILILFLNNPDKNPLSNLGAGLWETYEKVSGLMGDLMSYTRLFALGVSGAVLGFVFNELAVKMSPENIFARILVMTLILAFGHGLTLFMSCLGSFVHPVRLTFVEFYKNTGFSGTGKPYNPFSKKKNNN